MAYDCSAPFIAHVVTTFGMYLANFTTKFASTERRTMADEAHSQPIKRNDLLRVLDDHLVASGMFMFQIVDGHCSNFAQTGMISVRSCSLTQN